MGMLIGTRRALLKVGRAAPALTLTATTAGAGNVTIHRMTPATGTSLTIAWGDGSTTTVAAGNTASKVHTYAGAGTWWIRVTDARNIVQINLQDTQLSFAVGEIGNLTNLTNLYLSDLAGATIGAGEIGNLTNLSQKRGTAQTGITTRRSLSQLQKFYGQSEKRHCPNGHYDSSLHLSLKFPQS